MQGRKYQPFVHDLAASSGLTPSLTPTTSVQSFAAFQLKSLPIKLRRMWTYMTAICFCLRVGVDQPGSTAVINRDKLFKIIDSAEVVSPLLGTIYSFANTRGAVLGLIIQVFGAGYSLPTPYAVQIANSDADTAVDIYYRIPFALDFLVDPTDTSPLVAFFEGGELKIKLGATTVLDGDSTGAVIEATCNVNAWLEYVARSGPPLLHGPFAWQEYETAGSSTKHRLVNFGLPEALKGIAPGASLGALLMLTDATGMGLSGSDGADNVTSFSSPDLDQEEIRNIDALFLQFLRGMGGHATRAGQGFATSGATGGFPYTLAATTANKLNDAQALFLPLKAPVMGQQLTKLKRFDKPRDILLTYGFTSNPSGTMRHLALAFYSYTEEYKRELARAIGVDGGTWVPKLASKPATVSARVIASAKHGVKQTNVGGAGLDS